MYIKRYDIREKVLHEYPDLEEYFKIEYPSHISKSDTRFECYRCGYTFTKITSGLVSHKYKEIKCQYCTRYLDVIVELNQEVKELYHGRNAIVYDYFPKWMTHKISEIELHIDGVTYYQEESNFRSGRKVRQISNVDRQVDFKYINQRIHNMNPTLSIHEYNGSDNPVKIRCLDCKHVFPVTNIYNLYLRPHSCPKCAKENNENSSLEMHTSEMLTKLGVKYSREVNIDSKVGSRCQKMDFNIFNEDQMVLSIEAQGSLHYEYGFEPTDVVQARDLRKYLYNVDNKIPLTYIKYEWSYNKSYEHLEDSIIEANQLNLLKQEFEQLMQFNFKPSEIQHTSQCIKAYKIYNTYLKRYYYFMSKSLQTVNYLVPMLPAEYQFLLSEATIDEYVDALTEDAISNIPTVYQSLQFDEVAATVENIQKF